MRLGLRGCRVPAYGGAEPGRAPSYSRKGVSTGQEVELVASEILLALRAVVFDDLLL